MHQLQVRPAQLAGHAVDDAQRRTARTVVVDAVDVERGPGRPSSARSPAASVAPEPASTQPSSAATTTGEASGSAPTRRMSVIGSAGYAVRTRMTGPAGPGRPARSCRRDPGSAGRDAGSGGSRDQDRRRHPGPGRVGRAPDGADPRVPDVLDDDLRDAVPGERRVGGGVEPGQDPGVGAPPREHPHGLAGQAEALTATLMASARRRKASTVPFAVAQVMQRPRPPDGFGALAPQLPGAVAAGEAVQAVLGATGQVGPAGLHDVDHRLHRGGQAVPGRELRDHLATAVEVHPERALPRPGVEPRGRRRGGSWVGRRRGGASGSGDGSAWLSCRASAWPWLGSRSGGGWSDPARASGQGVATCSR